MRKIGFLILSIFYSHFAYSVMDVDFDHSSGLDLMQQFSAKYEDPEATKKIQILKKTYEKLLPSKVTNQATPIIPKVIHQIWLGPKEMPANFKFFQQTWKMFHPDWQFKVWDEKAILNENLENIDLYWLARSYQEKSDLVRYEILKKYGGLYIDTDIECFANFDELHHKYDFYTNFEPPAINKKKVSILNAMIASVPSHPILIETLQQIRRNWTRTEEAFDSTYNNINKSSFARSNHNLAVQRTMHPFGESVLDYLSKTNAQQNKSIVLPSGYNEPVYFINDIPIINFLSRLFRDKAKLSNQIKKRPETMSIHFHDKENSLMVDDFFANSLFAHSEIKGVFYMIFNLKDKYYLSFRKLFQTNFPTYIEYSTTPNIPKIIYINAANKTDQLPTNLVKWQELNPQFTIKSLTSAELVSYLPKSADYLDLETKIALAKFYILKTSGGVVVDESFEPADLLEFNQKYGYYGKIEHIGKFSDKIFLDTAIIASTKNHSFIRNMLLNVEDILNQKRDLNSSHIRKLYREYVQRYLDLDGKSIVFPELYFSQKR
jgi:hypothetical protein